MNILVLIAFLLFIVGGALSIAPPWRSYVLACISFGLALLALSQLGLHIHG
jgi:hypothetical protein